MDARLWAGRLYLGERRVLYSGPVLPTSMHAHHAHQVLLSPDGPVGLQSNEGEPEHATAFVIPANVPHAIVTAAERCVIAFIDPDEREGRALGRMAPPIARAAAFQRSASRLSGLAWPAFSTWHDADALTRTITHRLVGEHAPLEVRHPAVRRTLRELPARVKRGEVRLEAVALGSGVSASRLAHLFSAEVGIPMRPYVLWLRLRLAAAELSTGSSVTQAAHAAGFADGAHIARVWRRMFGISPSQMALLEWVPPPEATGAAGSGLAS
jgi:AraC-like DNA-binding protein